MKTKLKVGDVVLIKQGGYGFKWDDVGKYVEVVEHGEYRDVLRDVNTAGVRIIPYDTQLETEKPGINNVVGLESFGVCPVVKLNTLEDDNTEQWDNRTLGADEEYVAVSPPEMEEEVERVIQDYGKHYRYSFRLNLSEEDIANGFVMVKVDPYRVSTVYNLGGWQEHLVKKTLRGTGKGHTEIELIEELQCTIDRAREMYYESLEKDDA
tara:strand:+ start:35771 stop:36397 length:627 start_codon:yes stop_codon:yes gene_type:complete